ncbi:ABC transporter ATP-binding protein [Pseudoxanthomonas mexicana]|uniref:ABC transporter ATP-binding protein n=1 Tax=Pseudoxanthomonas mexicana TaxID=128785 RepID=UPI0007849B8E|nr:ABC transporter ATP-binding protein [Pseudoxanthomonas mexicana]
MSSDIASSQGSAGEDVALATAETIISVRGVSKCYRVYDRPEDRLKQSILSRLRRWLRRPPRDYFREFWALRDVSLDVRRGETLGIIGRNGSGKSTLLQVICGTLAPTQGEVDVKGRIAGLLELGAGFNPDFTGRENVYMSAAVLGLSQEQIDQRFDSIAAFADIGDFIEQPIKTYSSGMYVRLAFAVVAHVDADILVIDEALSVGDVFFGQKCMRFLRKFKEHGTVVFVSHDATAVINLCDRAVLLEGSGVRLQGDPKAVSEAYHAAIYQQSVRSSATREPSVEDVPVEASEDFRKALIDGSTLRNDLHVFRFDPEKSGFGNGAASIVSARITDDEGAECRWITGGEPVSLRIEVKAHRRLASPIIGFFVKDRLGQPLFGDNTFQIYKDAPVALDAGDCLMARFDFVMPILPKGAYTVDMAIADGTYDDHEQAEWVHDGLVIESQSSSVSTGLIGIPFRDIRIHKVP